LPTVPWCAWLTDRLRRSERACTSIASGSVCATRKHSCQRNQGRKCRIHRLFHRLSGGLFHTTRASPSVSREVQVQARGGCSHLRRAGVVCRSVSGHAALGGLVALVPVQDGLEVLVHHARHVPQHPRVHHVRAVLLQPADGQVARARSHGTHVAQHTQAAPLPSKQQTIPLPGQSSRAEERCTWIRTHTHPTMPHRPRFRRTTPPESIRVEAMRGR
jgi:hypothetical protein